LGPGLDGERKCGEERYEDEAAAKHIHVRPLQGANRSQVMFN
jgi:hypothetical protein